MRCADKLKVFLMTEIRNWGSLRITYEPQSRTLSDKSTKTRSSAIDNNENNKNLSIKQSDHCSTSQQYLYIQGNDSIHGKDNIGIMSEQCMDHNILQADDGLDQDLIVNFSGKDATRQTRRKKPKDIKTVVKGAFISLRGVCTNYLGRVKPVKIVTHMFVICWQVAKKVVKV